MLEGSAAGGLLVCLVGRYILSYYKVIVPTKGPIVGEALLNLQELESIGVVARNYLIFEVCSL